MAGYTIWLKKTVTLFVGGDPLAKPTPTIPVVTAKLLNPQVLIDEEKGTITIIETK